MTVYDLNRDQLDELKNALFWSDDPETAEILGDDIATPEQIPDDIIFQHYAGIDFVNDDFFCSVVEEMPLAIPF